jgi:hypothetical protein
MGYIIGSGWWCINDLGHTHKNKKCGHPYTRSPDFHKLWSHCIFKYTKPEGVIITDSAAPVKPVLDPREQMISLNKNYGIGGEFDGWHRGFAMGAWYAWNCDSDYIYVEQDCIVHGNIADEIYKKAPADTMMIGGTSFRDCKRVPWNVQLAVIFVPRNLILNVINEMVRCKKWTPEARMHEIKVKAQHLPFGYGRILPINFNDNVWYAQHFTVQELNTILNIEGDILDRCKLMKSEEMERARLAKLTQDQKNTCTGSS